MKNNNKTTNKRIRWKVKWIPENEDWMQKKTERIAEMKSLRITERIRSEREKETENWMQKENVQETTKYFPTSILALHTNQKHENYIKKHINHEK